MAFTCYQYIKYTIYLNTVLVVMCALLMYAEDYELNKSANSNKRSQQFINYTLLFVNVGACSVIYFFLYDRYLKKILYHILLLFVVLLLRAMLSIKFLPYHNVPNLLGVLISSLYIWFVMSGGPSRISLNRIMQVQVDKNGYPVIKKKNRNSSASNPTTLETIQRSLFGTPSNSDNKSLKSSKSNASHKCSKSEIPHKSSNSRKSKTELDSPKS